MGKASMCMVMLQILNTGRVYKCSELAALMDTNSRNIIEYKKELEEAGYYIISIPGKYGGYKLDKSDVFPSLKLKEDEKRALVNLLEYVLAKKDFAYKNELQTAMSKVLSSFMHSNIESYVVNVKSLDFNKDEEFINKFQLIEKCIKSKKVIELFYYNDNYFFRFRWIKQRFRCI